MNSLKIQMADLRHALVGGPDEPPEMLRGLRRWPTTQLAAVTVTALVLLLAFALVVGVGLTPHRYVVGGGRWALLTALWLVLLVVTLRRPLLAWRIVALALVYEVVLNSLRNPMTWRTDVVAFPDWMPPLFVSPLQVGLVLLVLFLVAASQPRGVVFWVWLFTTGLVVPLAWTASGRPTEVVGRWGLGWITYGPSFWGNLLPLWTTMLGAVLLVTLAVVAGQLVRSQSGTRRELAEVQERGLVLDERARIARELHDVVAHHVSMIAVRSETAPYRLGELPEQARA